MKLAVVTIACGDYHTEMGKLTHPSISSYAKKIGADFIVIDEKTDGLPHYLKFKLNKLLKKYDRIMYIDTDIIVREDSPNIFDEVPADCVGVFEEGRFAERANGMNYFLQENGIDPKTWDKKYYNTGVMVVSKEHANMFIKPLVEHNHFFEQSYINLLFSVFKTKIHSLDYKFNRMYIMDKLTGEERHDSYFLHYAGCNLLMSKEALFKMIVDDLEVWKKDQPDYIYKKNIAVVVEGGLGDQISAEPTVRYIRDKVYKGDNVIVITDFPDVFHNIGLKVYKKGEKIEEAKGFYELHTLRSPDHISWEFMSHPLTHTMDFASLQALRMTLPLEYKKIKLDVDLESVVSLNEKLGSTDKLVLVHPGRGWDSKTFPADVWESYINAIVGAGYRVAIIGKRISAEQGVVELNLEPSDSIIDLTDKLTYHELVALIGTSRILISNDSAPIHIAGAFDNYIGLISTCKRPEHVIPYRKDQIYYKAESLEEYKLYDQYNSQPSQVNGATIDKCDEVTIRKCVPAASKILDFVERCYEEIKKEE